MTRGTTGRSWPLVASVIVAIGALAVMGVALGRSQRRIEALEADRQQLREALQGERERTSTAVDFSDDGHASLTARGREGIADPPGVGAHDPPGERSPSIRQRITGGLLERWSATKTAPLVSGGRAARASESERAKLSSRLGIDAESQLGPSAFLFALTGLVS